MNDVEVLGGEEQGRLRATRIIALAALAAGAGLAAWATWRARSEPHLREKAREVASAARRVYEHPDRVGRSRTWNVGAKIFETAASTMAKAIAAKLAIALFRTALIEPEERVAIVETSEPRFEPLPA